MIMEEQYSSNKTTISLQANNQTDAPSVLIVGKASFSYRETIWNKSSSFLIMNCKNGQQKLLAKC